MPRVTGFDVIKEIKKAQHPTKIIVLTVHISQEHVGADLQAGVEGYVWKGDDTTDS